MSTSIEDQYVLLIIDPQIDFHEGGNLGVVGIDDLGGKGAENDSAKIISLINEIKPKHVYVSLDTHTETHIGHSGFWNPPAVSTVPLLNLVIIEEDNEFLKSKKECLLNIFKEYIKHDSAIDYLIACGPPVYNIDQKENYTYHLPKLTGNDGVDTELLNWIKYYFNEMGKTPLKPLIWPTHCLEQSKTHEVHPPLKQALDTLGKPVEYHIKGQNEATEMYSIFSANVPATGKMATLYRGQYKGKTDKQNEDSEIKVPNSDYPDHANLNTNFNEGLYQKLISHNLPIVICGEALSHCVNYSTTDLINRFKTDSEENRRPISLLIDAASVVNLGDPNQFKDATQKFLDYCKDNNVNLLKVDEFKQNIMSNIKLQIVKPNDKAVESISKSFFLDDAKYRNLKRDKEGKDRREAIEKAAMTKKPFRGGKKYKTTRRTTKKSKKNNKK